MVDRAFFVPLPWPTAARMFIHSNCLHNRVRAVTNRVFINSKVTFPKDHMQRAADLVFSMFSQDPSSISPWSSEQVVASMGASKRPRYQAGSDSLLRFPLSRADAAAFMFVKADTLDFNSKDNPDPRAIQFFGNKELGATLPRYNLVLMRYTKPFEDFYYGLADPTGRFPTTRTIGKGLSPSQRSELLCQKLTPFRRPVFLPGDGKRFDGHFTLELLKFVEHRLYNMVFQSALLAQLLSWQLAAKGFGDGFSYRVAGKRLSGHPNTGLGNCVVMQAIVFSALGRVNYPWDVLIDGDDAVVVVEAEHAGDAVKRLTEEFSGFGHEFVFEKIFMDGFLERFHWCQSRPVRTLGGWKMIREPRRAMSKLFVGTKLRDPNMRGKLMWSRGMGELVTNLGVPIMQDLALFILRGTGKRDVGWFDAADHRTDMMFQELKHLGRTWNQVTPSNISSAARLSFERAFGITPHQQCQMEQALRTRSLNLGLPTVGVQHDDERWLYDWMQPEHLASGSFVL